MCLGGGWEVGAHGGGVENWQSCSPSPWPPAWRSFNLLLLESAPPSPPSEAFQVLQLSCCHPQHVVRMQNGLKSKNILYKMAYSPQIMWDVRSIHWHDPPQFCLGEKARLRWQDQFTLESEDLNEGISRNLPHQNGNPISQLCTHLRSLPTKHVCSAPLLPSGLSGSVALVSGAF